MNKRELRNAIITQGEPIWIPCEGSGVAGHDYGNMPGTRMCVMCGKDIQSRAGIVRQHDRDDIIARLRRGDFG